MRLAPLLLLLAGCAVEIGEERLEGDLDGPTREVCAVAPPFAHGPGVPLELGGQLRLLLSDVWRGDQVVAGSAMASAPDARGVCEGLTYAMQGEVPAELIPRTEAELAQRGARVALWPIAALPDGDAGFVFYEKVLVRGIFEVFPVGVGVARVTADGTVVRLLADAESDEPTLFWREPRLRWGSGAVLGGDGYAYVYGCERGQAFGPACAVARVPPAQAGTLAAYRYLRLDGSWGESGAADAFTAASSVAAVFDAALGRFLILYGPAFGKDVMARSPRRPDGPFDARLEPERFVTVPTTDAFGIGDVRVLGVEDGGRTLLLMHVAGGKLHVTERRIAP